MARKYIKQIVCLLFKSADSVAMKFKKVFRLLILLCKCGLVYTIVCDQKFFLVYYLFYSLQLLFIIIFGVCVSVTLRFVAFLSVVGLLDILNKETVLFYVFIQLKYAFISHLNNSDKLKVALFDLINGQIKIDMVNR